MVLLRIHKAKFYFNNANLPIWPKDGDTYQKMIALTLQRTSKVTIIDHTVQNYHLAVFTVLLRIHIAKFYFISSNLPI